MYFSKMLIPILPPKNEVKLIKRKQDYLFFNDTFTYYDLNGHLLVCDNHEEWVLLFEIKCNSLDELKLHRQILTPDYLKETHLPTVEMLANLNLHVRNENFDKAYGHVLYTVSDLSTVPVVNQMQIASYDGEDDPLVSSSMHYFDNIYKGKTTRFISGIETFSFGTITDNSFYAKHIWPETGLQYLLLFYYFKQYKQCPSQQMMPRLLCNLWQSTEILNANYNCSLFKKVDL